MRKTLRLKKLQRLKNMMQYAKRGVKTLLVMGLLFAAPAVWLFSLNDIGRTASWIALCSFFTFGFWAVASIVWFIGVKDTGERILHREL